MSKLFSPVTLGGESDPIVLQHRLTMAPLARLRADDDGVQPPYAEKYFAQRTTSGGLLISDPTNISPTARGAYGSPGIYTADQVDAWRPIVEAVHAKGGVIFMELTHAGRMSHPSLQPNNERPVSSSVSMPVDGNRVVPTRDGPLPLVEPRALEIREIAEIAQDFRRAAENALEAGFDGVQINAANGSLLEQFLHDGANDRTDAYGGSVENRSRFLFEVLDEVLRSIPSSRLAVRLSPYSKSCGQFDSNPTATYSSVLDRLNTYSLAYVYIIEPRGYHYVLELVPAGGAAAFFRQIYKGVLMTVSGYDRQNAIDIVEQGQADLVAIGRYFISNPDLVKRFQANAELAPYDRGTSYSSGEIGYTDYPPMEG